tara:strand:- start:2167 stop:2559 length:393 start_codon:yes stop_codon:yes gene_type:complete
LRGLRKISNQLELHALQLNLPIIVLTLYGTHSTNKISPSGLLYETKKMDTMIMSSSLRAFELHTLGTKAFTKYEDKGWFDRIGWYELRKLEELFPLDKWTLSRINHRTFKGISSMSNEVDSCIEFKAIKK